MSQRWLFVCSCIALVTSAFTFSLHGDVMQLMGTTFNFSQSQNGSIGQAIFYGMAASMLLGGFICDALGLKKIMWLAAASHLFGTLGMVLSKPLFGETPDTAYYWLYGSGLLMGCGNGFTEVAINPLVATLYKNEKTHYLNILHAWWPGGLVIGGLLALAMREYVAGSFPAGGSVELWQISLGLIILPTLVYATMLIPAQFPATERVESGVSTGAMLSECIRPMFLLWAFCMLLTAATELGPQKWQESVMRSVAEISGTLILIYTSGMMFVLRHFAGPIAHRISPIGLLTVSAVLASSGLFLLSYANDLTTALLYATLFGLGVAYFWPTMLGVAAERFPKGGALALCLMGSAGNVSIAFVLPLMGSIADHYTVAEVQQDHPQFAQQILKADDAGKFTALNPQAVETLKLQQKSTTQPIPALQAALAAERQGFSEAFRFVALWFPTPLIVIFSLIFLGDLARGGYKPEVLGHGDGKDPKHGEM